jgi:hypothetical protein
MEPQNMLLEQLELLPAASVPFWMQKPAQDTPPSGPVTAVG